MDPPVSDPRAKAASSAATATAAPPEDPPGTRSKSQGFLVLAKKEFSVEEPMANSSILTLPSRIVPAAWRRSVTVALYGGIKFSNIFEAQLVRTPSVHLSLIHISE